MNKKNTVNIFLQAKNKVLPMKYNKDKPLSSYFTSAIAINKYRFFLNNKEMLDINEPNNQIKEGDIINMFITAPINKKILSKKYQIHKELKEVIASKNNINNLKAELSKGEAKTNQSWDGFFNKKTNPKYNPYYIYGPDKKPLKNKIYYSDKDVYMIDIDEKEKISEEYNIIPKNKKIDDYSIYERDIYEKYTILKNNLQNLKNMYSVSFKVYVKWSEDYQVKNYNIIIYSNEKITTENLYNYIFKRVYNDKEHFITGLVLINKHFNKYDHNHNIYIYQI